MECPPNPVVYHICPISKVAVSKVAIFRWWISISRPPHVDLVGEPCPAMPIIDYMFIIIIIPILSHFFGWPAIYLSQIRKHSSFPTCFILKSTMFDGQIHHVQTIDPVAPQFPEQFSQDSHGSSFGPGSAWPGHATGEYHRWCPQFLTMRIPCG